MTDSKPSRPPERDDVVYFLSCTNMCAHRGSRLENWLRGQRVRLHESPDVDADGSIAAWFTVLDGPAEGERHCAFFHYERDRFTPDVGDVVRVTGFGPTSAHHVGSDALIGCRARIVETRDVRDGRLHARFAVLDGPRAGDTSYSCDLLCEPADHDFRDHGDTVVATAEHDIRAGEIIEINPATGRARPTGRCAGHLPRAGDTVEVRDSEGNVTRGYVTHSSYTVALGTRDELNLTILVERGS